MKNNAVAMNDELLAANRLSSVILRPIFWGKVIASIVMLFALPSMLIAQADSTQPHAVDMATTMRSNGKIYVVVAVLTIILFGLFLYLIRLDRKINKLEKE